MPDRKLRVFLCHSSQDKPIVRELYQRLNAEGWIDPWLDEENLLPGQDWDMEIEKAVEVSDAVIVFLSDNSVTKEGYIQRELRLVLRVAEEKPEGTIYIIPMRLNNCSIPRRLRDWQYVDFFPATNMNKAYGRMIESLKLRSELREIQTKNTNSTLISGSLSIKDQIIELMKKHDFVTSQMVVDFLGVKRQNVVRILRMLTEQGLIFISEDKEGMRKYSLTRMGTNYNA